MISLLRGRPHVMFLASILLPLLFWIWIPPFDYDEALYAEMGRHMLATGDFFATEWGGRLMTDKPPLFMWLLMPFIDLEGSPHGLTRLVSLFCSFTISLFVALWIRGRERRREDFPLWKTVLMYFVALLPGMGSGLLLLDPFLTLMLTCVLLIFADAWKPGEAAPVLPKPLALWKTFSAALAMGIACWTKGLVAFVLPALALLLAMVFQLRSARLTELLRAYTRSFLPAGLLGLLMGAAFYVWLWSIGHREFVAEFFVKHHLSRGTAAMEGHGGSPLYHWIVILFGGGWVSAVLLIKGSSPAGRRVLTQPQNLFIFSWLLAVPLFFTFMATKLPNYTWPAWPALTLLALRLCAEPNVQDDLPSRQQRRGDSIFRNLCRVLVTMSVVAFALIGFALLSLPVLLPNLPFKVDPRAALIFQGAGRLTTLEMISALLCGMGFLGISREIYLLMRSGRACLGRVTLWSSLILTSLLGGFSSYPQRAFVDPLVATARHAAKHFPQHKIVTFELKSPLFNLAYYTGSSPQIQEVKGHIRHVGNSSRLHLEPKREPQLLVVTEAALGKCKERNYPVTFSVGYLRLCASAKQ